MEELFCSVQLTIISFQSGNKTIPRTAIGKRTLKKIASFREQRGKFNINKDNIQVFCHRKFHNCQKILLFDFLVFYHFPFPEFLKYIVFCSNSNMFLSSFYNDHFYNNNQICLQIHGL